MISPPLSERCNKCLVVRFGLVFSACALVYTFANLQKPTVGLLGSSGTTEQPKTPSFGKSSTSSLSTGGAETYQTSDEDAYLGEGRLADVAVVSADLFNTNASRGTSSGGRIESVTLPTPPPLTANFTPLSTSDIAQLRTFVLFLGFGKTFHSILGALLDAHPDIIIAHEYSVLKDVSVPLVSKPDWLLQVFNHLYQNSHRSAVEGWRSKANTRKGYTLGVTNGKSWQGRFRRLTVIGDKSGHLTVKQYLANKARFLYLVSELNRTLGVLARGIRVMRNPYDTIATTLLLGEGGPSGLKAAKTLSHDTNHRTHSSANLNKYIEEFSQRVNQTERVLTQIAIPTHSVHLVDLIHDPRSVMLGLCNAFHVECFTQYLDLCQDKLFKNISMTRYLLEWSPEQIESVVRIMHSHPEYSRYSFNCNC